MTKSNKNRFSISATELSAMPDKTAVFDIYYPIRLPDDVGGTVQALQGEIRFQLQDRFILCQGGLQATIGLVCDRCLAPYILPLDIHIDEAIQVVNSQLTWEQDTECLPHDPTEQVRVDESIEIADLLYQHLVLNIPYQKICSETCYNEHLIQLNQTISTVTTEDSPWQSVRHAVERWEQDKK